MLGVTDHVQSHQLCLGDFHHNSSGYLYSTWGQHFAYDVEFDTGFATDS